MLTRDTKTGYEASGNPKTATSYRTWLFSGGWPPSEGWPAKNIHTDLTAARSSGLPARAASGAMLEGYLSELMVDLGEDWLSEGVFSLKFTRVVAIEDTIVSRATVVSRRHDGSKVRYDLELRRENQRGEVVAVGESSGWVG